MLSGGPVHDPFFLLLRLEEQQGSVTCAGDETRTSAVVLQDTGCSAVCFPDFM